MYRYQCKKCDFPTDDLTVAGQHEHNSWELEIVNDDGSPIEPPEES